MIYAISFNSDKFDLKNEIENTINPIKGKSVGEWLNPLLEDNNILTSSIEEEDWGWYSYATLNDQKYLVGYIAIPEDSNGNFAEVIIQIQKERKFFEQMLGRNQLSKDDPLVKIISAIVKNIK